MKKLIVWLLVLCMTLTAFAALAEGNYTDDMKYIYENGDANDDFR